MLVTATPLLALEFVMANEAEIKEAFAVLGLLPGAPLKECEQACYELSQMWDPGLFSVGSREHTRAEAMRDRLNRAMNLIRALTVPPVRSVSGGNIPVVSSAPAPAPRQTNQHLTAAPAYPHDY